MIGYLKGKVIWQDKQSIILSVNNVGYKVYTKIDSNKQDSELELFIYTNVSQDAIRLFGFSSQKQLNIFQSLIEVSGVGPKLAQQILNFMGEENFVIAINNQDASLFSAVPKVGPKLATKIIIELKDKISWENATDLTRNNPELDNIVMALERLGYKKGEFLAYIGKIPSQIDNESEKLKWLLNQLKKS